MLSPDSGMDLLVWLALGVAYGVSVWLLLRQERHGAPPELGHKAGITLPFPRAIGSTPTATEDNVQQQPDTPGVTRWGVVSRNSGDGSTL